MSILLSDIVARTVNGEANKVTATRSALIANYVFVGSYGIRICGFDRVLTLVSVYACHSCGIGYVDQ